MSAAQRLHILRHSLGVGEDGRGTAYRNHFVTGPGSTDYATCMALVSNGLMTRRDGSALTGGDDCFHVTAAGREFVAQHAPPPLTRSQRRYQNFLDADCGLRFGEWLKSQAGSTAS